MKLKLNDIQVKSFLTLTQDPAKMIGGRATIGAYVTHCCPPPTIGAFVTDCCPPPTIGAFVTDCC